MTSGFSWGFEWATPSVMQCFHKRCHQGCGLRTCQTDMGHTTCFLPPHQSCAAHDQLQELEAMVSDAEGGRQAPVAAATLPFSQSTQAPAEAWPG